MEFQRHENKDALTIEQQEGYIIGLQDRLDTLKRDIEQYKESLAMRKKLENT